MLKIKRAYEIVEPSDGTRVLIDRLWPRGMSKENAKIDEWLKDIAPSSELRKWFGHEPEKWPEFKKRYLQELKSPESVKALKHIADLAARGDVTIVYGAKDTEHNDARVLLEVLTKIK